MDFYIGQIFSGDYPEEASNWCKANGATITEQEMVNGVRQFAIVEVPPPPAPTPEEIIRGYEDAVQAYLDQTAQSRDYDNTYTCLSYLSSTDEVWNREANAFNAWRDQVWRKCHEILNAVMAGEIEAPTVEGLIVQLPVIDWNDPEEA